MSGTFVARVGESSVTCYGWRGSEGLNIWGNLGAPAFVNVVNAQGRDVIWSQGGCFGRGGLRCANVANSQEGRVLTLQI